MWHIDRIFFSTVANCTKHKSWIQEMLVLACLNTCASITEEFCILVAKEAMKLSIFPFRSRIKKYSLSFRNFYLNTKVDKKKISHWKLKKGANSNCYAYVHKKIRISFLLVKIQWVHLLVIVTFWPLNATTQIVIISNKIKYANCT